MQIKNKYWKVIFFVFIMFTLSGCTRRQDLEILAGENTDVSGTAAQTDGTAWRNGGLTGQDGGTTGQSGNPAGQNGEVQQTGGAAGQDLGTAAQAGDAPRDKIVVHVCGAVNAAGVYELPAGSRVYEAVSAAGGFAGNADESYVNQAQALADGVKLVIPTVEEALSMREGDEGAFHGGGTAAGDDTAAGNGAKMEVAGIFGENAASSGQGADDGRVNINTATVTELCGISGIGTTRAQAIVSYRQEHGVFDAVEDIMKVDGIKEGTFEKIKDNIKVN